MPFVAWLEEPARVVVQTFINGAWQGVLLTTIVALVLRAVRRTSATTRHLIWCATLVGVVTLPLSAVSKYRSLSGPASLTVPASRAAVLPVESAATRKGAAPTAHAWTIRAPSGIWLVFLLGAALLIAAMRLGRVTLALRNLRQLKRRSNLLPAAHRMYLESVLQSTLPGRAPDLRLSNLIRTPITIGFVRPAILIPARLLTELKDKELAQIILHEVAHVRRRDDWINLAQRVIEAVFFFHPAVLWIGRQLDIERELACDDYAVAMLPGERSYAQCLTRLAELAAASRSAALAPGAAPRISQLGRRVHALLAPNRPRSVQLSVAHYVASAVVLIASVASLTRFTPTLALAGTEPSPAPPPALAKSLLRAADSRTPTAAFTTPKGAGGGADAVPPRFPRRSRMDPASTSEAPRTGAPDAVKLALKAEPAQSSTIVLEPAEIPSQALPIQNEPAGYEVAASQPHQKAVADVRVGITLQLPAGASLEDPAAFLPAGHGARYSVLPSPGSIGRSIGRGVKLRIGGSGDSQAFGGPKPW